MVRDGTIVGLGTGSTAVHVIRELGRRVSDDGLDIIGIPTSFDSDVLARQCGIPVRTLDDIDRIDIAIDGADEVDPDKQLIKGGGAAHTREKIIDGMADQFIVIVDESKMVDRLGESFPVPVEVIPMAYRPVSQALEHMGGKPVLRMGGSGKVGPVITDQGNMVIDVTFPAIPEPAIIEADINNIPGVLENGLFVDMASLILIGDTGTDGQPLVWSV